GGYFWAVDHAGHGPVETEKRVYGHAFALFALAECARLPEGEWAATQARHLLDLLDERFRDPIHRGYFRSRTRDWSGPGTTSSHWAGHRKSLNDHIHLLEALLALHPSASSLTVT